MRRDLGRGPQALPCHAPHAPPPTLDRPDRSRRARLGPRTPGYHPQKPGRHARYHLFVVFVRLGDAVEFMQNRRRVGLAVALGTVTALLSVGAGRGAASSSQRSIASAVGAVDTRVSGPDRASEPDAGPTRAPFVGPLAVDDAGPAPVATAPGTDHTPGYASGQAPGASTSTPGTTGGPNSGGSNSSGTVVADPANGWALLIGISHYQSPTHPTFGGTGDVAAFRDALVKAGWASTHILTLTDGAATGDAIRSSMNWLVTHSSPGAFSVFHYSGHVLQQNGQEFLWGADNTFLSNGEFGATLGRLQGRAWIDVAGCESAGFEAGLSSPLRFVTTSSMVNEKSYEREDWGQSVWTGLTVARGLVGHQADADRDGTVSIQEAVRWAQQQAPAMTSSQRPYGPQHPLAKGGQGEWYLGPAVAPAPPRPATSNPHGGSGGKGGQAPDRCGAVSANTAHCGV